MWLTENFKLHVASMVFLLDNTDLEIHLHNANLLTDVTLITVQILHYNVHYNVLTYTKK